MNRPTQQHRASSAIPGILAILALAFLGLLPHASADGTPGTIETFAGGGGMGDGGLATAAVLHHVLGVAYDASGDLYIADTKHHCIRKVDGDGVITTVAGVQRYSFYGGYSGDGGPALSAELNQPSGVAFDASGNLLIVDQLNHRIRKVQSDGTIVTVVGTGVAGFSGDDGPATSAKIYYPFHIAVDASGNLFIADAYNSRIRKVDTSGVITTVAHGYLSDVRTLALDGSGNLFIGDTSHCRVWKVDTDGVRTLVAGTGVYGFSGDGGPATDAKLGLVYGLAVDGDGNVYIADNTNGRIRKVSTGGTITTVAGPTGLSIPAGLAFDPSGNLIIANHGRHRVERLESSGQLTTLAGTGSTSLPPADGAHRTQAELVGPRGVAVDATGNVYIADWNHPRVRKVSPSGIISTVPVVGGVPNPSDVATDASVNLYILGGNQVLKVSAGGGVSAFAGTGAAGYSGDGSSATAAQINTGAEGGLATDSAGNLYIADRLNHRVRKVSTSGVITTVAGTGVAGLSGDGGPAEDAQLQQPSGVAVDATGRLFIADTGNNRVRVVDAEGDIHTFAGSTAGIFGDGGPAAAARLSQPWRVAVDAAGNVLIADTGNRRIRKVDTSGTITTVAGTGLEGLGGDGGPATSATFSSAVAGLAFDADGNLLICDSTNGRVRRVFGVGAPSSTFVVGPEAIAVECEDEDGAEVPILLEVGGAVPSGATLLVRDVTPDQTERGLYDEDAAVGDVGFTAQFPIGVSHVVAQVLDADGDVLAEATFTVQVEDTTAPELDGVADQEIELTGTLTPIHWTPFGITASDLCDPNPHVALSPWSLPLGTTTVTVTATDHSGNVASETFDVTVLDRTPPTFTTFPDSVVVECTDGTGEAAVAFDLVAGDLSGGVTLSCEVDGESITVGSHTFAVGEHVVDCFAEDSSGNVASASFTVTVVDRSDPVLILPADIVVGNDEGLPTAEVEFEVTASDDAGDVTIACHVEGVPVASGDAFPIGLTVVTCTATDEAGNVAEGAFRVRVEDRESPAISGPTTATLVTTCAGAALTVGPRELGLTATDNYDPAPVLSCSPSVLEPGTTTVTCTAVDQDGNASEHEVEVTVLRGAFDVLFQRPLDPTIDNRFTVGQTLPVKISVRCGGTVVTNVSAWVHEVVTIDGSGTPITEDLDDSGEANDDGTAMRLSDGKYIHNLSTEGWTSTSGQRFRLTVKVSRTGHVDTYADVVLKNR